VRASIVIVLLAVPLLSGCATGGREADVRSVANRFATAVGDRDGAAACALLTVPARQQLVADERKPCAKAVVGLDVSKPPVGRVEVFITSASAQLEGGGTLFLDQTTHGWRISAAGCEPKPGDAPYDCDLTA
jgi:hypothetical protein